MRKFNVFFALVLVAQLSLAATVTKPAEIPAYYSGLDGKSGSALWSATSSAANKGFKTLGYSGLWTAYAKTDVYPADSAGKAGKIWDMYGECTFTYSKDQCGTYSGVCDCYNREHSIPKSWFGGGTSGIGCDIFHLVPTDGKINGTRSNDEFGEIAGEPNYYGNKTGAAGSWSTDRKTIASAAGESVKGTGNVFEPKPQYKGDFARGYMGTIVKWQLANMTTENNFFSGVYDAANYFGFTKKAVILMMKWHREDPVSQKEIDRNNGIQETQGNRNPFIDYPYLAEYIWGEHAGETIDMSKLMPSTDPDFVPGVSDGWRGSSTPVVPTVKYGVNWSINGAIDHTDSVAENAKIAALPAAPTSCSTESATFMGWTTAAISGTTDEAPIPCITALADFPAVTADITYYAVFAKETSISGAAPASYTYSADSNIEGWENTATNKGSYWLLDDGKSLVSPEIDLMGLTSVVATLRTYGGTQYDQFAISSEDGLLATITVEKGSTLTEYTWTNNLYVAGTSKLTFTCSNAASGKGVGFSSVTINAAGSGYNYSRYITSCQSGTEVELLPVEETAKKILVGGQIFLQIGDHLYNITGQKVK